MEVTEKVLGNRPENFVKKLSEGSKICCINLKPIMNVLKNSNVIIMACNTRIKHVIPGIMRAAEDLDAVVGFELAKTEAGLPDGYTGMDPELYVNTIIEYAEKVNYTVPFFIHGDHITVKKNTEEDIDSARELIAAQLLAGYSSFAIDASYNELSDNIEITIKLARPIVERGLCLEAEVGEIKGEEDITTVDDAVSYIDGLEKNGINPDLLAINNGSKHGNYLEGEKVHIDLARTLDIYNAVKDKGVAIAQHGITGTPLHLMGRFADYGIRKGNVGTNWQNIAHEHMPVDLMSRMKKWAEDNGKDIKFTTKEFFDEISNIPEECKKKIEEAAYKSATEFIKTFRSEGTASKVVENL